MHRKTLAALGALCASLIAGEAQATLVISTAPTSNVTCTAGACTTTAADAVLNVDELAASLQLQDTSVTAPMPIEFDAPMHWASAHLLSLDAYYSITFTQPVISEGTGGVRLATRKSGDFYFTGAGRLAFWDTSSVLLINTRRYTLVKSLAALDAAIAAKEEGYFALADNYDASADGTYSQSPVNHLFLQGAFEGLGNSISHLSMGCCGLFAYLPVFGPAIRDFALVGVVLRTTQASHVGAAVGRNDGGNVIAVSVSGLVSAGNGQPNAMGSVGGLVGTNGNPSSDGRGIVLRSHSSARVSCGFYCYVGGIVGDNQFDVKQSSATGSVRGGKNSAVGGLVGHNGDASILLSYATGAVSVGDAVNSRPTRSAMAGGLVGYNDVGLVDHSYATGPVSGGSGVQRSMNQVFVGGLVGGNGGTVRWCYATGAVSVGDRGYVGGLTGSFDVSRINSCYSTGQVSVTGGSSVVGGLTGADTGPVSPYATNYWDLDTSGVSDPSQGAGNVSNDTGIGGLTTSQFQSGLPFGFDAGDWAENPAINNGLPYLLALPPS